MKKTNKIISLMLSIQLVATSVSAGPASLQKQPKLRTETTVPLGSKDKKSIDTKTMAKKTVLFPLKALWWVTKPQLIMLGTGIFDLSLLAVFGGYRAYKWCKENPILVEVIAHYNFTDSTLIRTPLSEEKAKALCADMRYCLAKMQKKGGSVSSETSSEYKNIAEKYSSLTDELEIMDEFLSHFELIEKYLNDITERLINLSDTPVYVYNKEYCIFAFDKSFKIGDQTIEKIINKFYKACAVTIHPDKNKCSPKYDEALKKLNAWYEIMKTILQNSPLAEPSAETMILTFPQSEN